MKVHKRFLRNGNLLEGVPVHAEQYMITYYSFFFVGFRRGGNHDSRTVGNKECWKIGNSAMQ